MVYVYETVVAGAAFEILAPETNDENHQLIQFGFPTDTWFHIDSSKYLPVYLRQPIANRYNIKLDLSELPSPVISSCCQILKYRAKAKRDVTVKYSLLSNLSLNGPLDNSLVQSTVSKTKKTGEIANPELLSTEKKKAIDFEAERNEYEREVRKQTSEHFRKTQKVDRENSRQFKQLAEQKHRGYSDLFEDDDAMRQSSNQNRPEDWEDDFM